MRCVAKNTMLEKIMLIRVAAEVNFGNVEASGASNSIPRGERNECEWTSATPVIKLISLRALMFQRFFCPRV
jgi:hypothetical protein